MSRRVYVGVEGIARRVKKIYVGVNGIARQVKRAYVGVTNLARQFFGGFDSIQETANPTAFIESPYDDGTTYSFSGIAAGKIANKYAVFAGSYSYIYLSSSNQYHPSKYAYAVDKDLIVTKAANLMRYSAFMHSANTKNYATFAGGYGSTTSTTTVADWQLTKYCPLAYAYGADLTRHDLANLYTSNYENRTTDAFSAGNGQSAIYPFWGYATSGAANLIVYNNELVQSALELTSNTSDRIGSLGACQFGTHAVFFGQMNGISSSAAPTSHTCAYDQSLTKIAMGNLSDAPVKGYPGACASSNNYVVFVGGADSSQSTYYKTLNAYDRNLIKVSTTAALTFKSHHLGAVTIDNWFVFCGGRANSTTSIKDVNFFDENLIRTSATITKSYGLYDVIGESVGDYGIFVGGTYGISSRGTNIIIFQGV